MSGAKWTTHSNTLRMIYHPTCLVSCVFTGEPFMIENAFMYRCTYVNRCATAGAICQLLYGSKRAWDEREIGPVAAFPCFVGISHVGQKVVCKIVRREQQE